MAPVNILHLDEPEVHLVDCGLQRLAGTLIAMYRLAMRRNSS